MLERQRGRLLRQEPWDITDLAQELYALFGDDEPLQVPGIEITQSNENPQPAVIINNAPQSTTLFQINRPGAGTFTLSLNGGVLEVSSPDGKITVVGVQRAAARQSGPFPGKLIAYLENNLYTVTIYPKGITGASEDVSVLQLQGDPLFPHLTDGTVWGLVGKGADNVYFMAIPTWE